MALIIRISSVLTLSEEKTIPTFMPFIIRILVEIPDDVFYAAMLTLFYTERVSKAYRMLQIRKQWDHLSSDMEKLKEDIELFRKAADHYEFHRMKEAEQIISDLCRNIRDIRDL